MFHGLAALGPGTAERDLERLPSGKFDTNTLDMAAGTYGYNVLRWIGPQG
ncbi:hypothetical protein [Ectothiorhodospira sp. BSL-9]|nr:hypothetical protein [Ectothiorhodospira sp. BSL-9]